MKPWYRSRTIWVGILTALAGVLSTVTNDAFIAQNPKLVSFCATVLGLVHIALRFVTSQDVALTAEKEAE